MNPDNKARYADLPTTTTEPDNPHAIVLDGEWDAWSKNPDPYTERWYYHLVRIYDGEPAWCCQVAPDGRTACALRQHGTLNHEDDEGRRWDVAGNVLPPRGEGHADAPPSPL